MWSQNNPSFLSRKEFLIRLGTTMSLSSAGILFSGCHKPTDSSLPGSSRVTYSPKTGTDVGGYILASERLVPWPADAPLNTIADAYRGIADRIRAELEKSLTQPGLSDEKRIQALCAIASMHNYEGNPTKAYSLLEQARKEVSGSADLASHLLYTVIYHQGVTGLRQEENENCVLCIGYSACILPIVPAAVHTKPEGSRRAIKHFTEYLQQFPDDLEVRWLLNLAHMTLG